MRYERLPVTLRHKLSDVDIAHQFSVSETYPLHSHEFLELFLVTRGSAIHSINGKSVPLSKGDMVFIRPEDIHKYEAYNQAEFELVSLSVGERSFTLSCRLLELDPGIFLSPEDPPRIRLEGMPLGEMRKKLAELDGKAVGEERMRYFRSILPGILLLFTEGEETSAERPLPFWLSEAVGRMDQPANIREGLPALYRLAGVSKEHLAREFRKYLGLTPSEFVNMKRMNYAAGLLGEGEEIQAVSRACGYHSLSYFYRVFLRHYGCAPGEFTALGRRGEERQGPENRSKDVQN